MKRWDDEGKILVSWGMIVGEGGSRETKNNREQRWSEAELTSEALDARLRALGEEECRDVGVLWLGHNELTFVPESITRLSNLKE